MSDVHDDAISAAAHDHRCGDLFGCGEERGTGAYSQGVVDARLDARRTDRLLHMDEIDQERLDAFVTTRGRSRRELLATSASLGMLAAVGPWFTRAAGAAARAPAGAQPFAETPSRARGRVHVVEADRDNTHLGVFDTTLPPILTIESGDSVRFTNTWSHFLNQLHPGTPVETLAQLRLSNPGRGPHSIIGPIAVKDAQPGDVLEVRYERLVPDTWGAVFNNPGALGTGLLPGDYPQGQVKYLELDLKNKTAEFLPHVTIPLQPFQGTLGVAPPDGYFAPLSPGVTSSVPPGPHAGNTDLRDMAEGSTMFIPVWKPGALIFTGDSHAVQGDGEINLSALETRMKEMQIEVVLHKQKNFAWPIAETPTHWIVLGFDKDLNAAITMAARNAIKFLASRAHMTELDAYGLLSIACSFRITQVVNIVRGVHAMIPKSLFDAELRREIRVV